MQRKFLGFLQRSEYDRVGGKHPFTSRCRIIAATNRNLAEMVNSGLFRQDLFFRLKVVMIHVRRWRTDGPTSRISSAIFCRKSTGSWARTSSALKRALSTG